MTNKELKLKLQALHEVRGVVAPDIAWTAATRAALLRQIGAEASGSAEGQLSMPVVLPRTFMSRFMFVMRPVVAAFMLIGIGIAGWAAGVSSSLSLANKTGEPLKAAAELTQLTFTADPAARAYLHLELAGRRANEVAVIAETAGVTRETDMMMAMNDLQDEIANVQQNLDEVAAAKSNDTSAVAKAVDRKVAEINAVMNKTKNLLSQDAQTKAVAVQAAADDVSLKAVAVLVAGAKTAEDKTDATARVQDKLATAEKDLQVASTEAGDQAKAALVAAKAALAKDDLTEAVIKIQESATIAGDAAAKAEITNNNDQTTNSDQKPNINLNVNTNTNANSNTNTGTGKIKAIGF